LEDFYMLRPISIRRFSFSLLFVGMGLGGWGASAQESINYASVSGRVTDPTGAVIEGVGVMAHQIDTNLASTAPERVGCPKVWLEALRLKYPNRWDTIGEQSQTEA
jgi:hypothetical protein